VERELAHGRVSNQLTAGERLYSELGVRGARGQAEDGYPLLRSTILPLLRGAQAQTGEAFRWACLDALLLSMAELEDSCLLARGGAVGLAAARQGAKAVLRLGGTGSQQGMRALLELDGTLTRAGLSPGGSADMVAAGIFLVSAEAALTP
jgi:triphosphoribosyl-dephospho-CoA synthase